ncbi:hypothetical protein BAUCODRAFT_355172 [Baudoinia panamericana UAMH 10762]|uniref:N-acetylgalactosaminide beta-1,3-galactosyltransferase n=1 Tax=Baudoinia panamericana (strain UAMH 10762) TaxID=717646 RepID=M2N740_BAUPA|nr:uncharacterized protein BAUCODRAFT_355172 [Baudoinia panamericana UAMH 10762]EMC99918.1 hypothetical protein BAUCODRAFT_355172 [Baudoinia panamericana UAMH 10762]
MFNHVTEVPKTHDEEYEESRPTASVKQVSYPTPTSSINTANCPVVADSKDFLISMKTGATELYAKLPEHLMTTLRCVPNYMIFSDLEQDISDYHVHSALEDVSDKYKYSHRDFEFYRRLLDLAAKGQDLSLMKITTQAHGSAWDLDKWKFVPITHKTYAAQPDAKWYIFLEADSYMAWPNVLELLAQYDPGKPWYLGAVHFFGDTAFAHGGMGYFISNAAMRKLDAIWDRKHITKWERMTAEGCCGDVDLGAVLYEAGVNLTGIPGLYGEGVTWFEWDPERWCEPAISWHHMRAHDVESLYQFETKWLGKGETHYVYRDLFVNLVEPHIASTRSDWDNASRDRIYTGLEGLHGDEDRRFKKKTIWSDLEEQEQEDVWRELNDGRKESIENDGYYLKDNRWDELSDEERETAFSELHDWEQVAHESLRNCRVACEEWNECMQFFYSTTGTGRCHLHRRVRLGHYLDARDVEVDEDTGLAVNRTTSGWMMDRVRDMKDRAERCESVPNWMRKYAENERLNESD